MTDNAPRTSSTSTDDWGGPTRPPGPGNSDQPGDPDGGFIDRLLDRLPYWLTWRETFLGALLGIAALIVLVLAIAFATTFFDSGSLSGTLAQVDEHRSGDNYDGWVASHDAAERIATYTPGGFRSFFHTLGIVVPRTSPSVLRAELEREHAFAASVLEHRFESADRRNAAHLSWSAFDEETMTPISAASRIHRHLTRGRLGEAVVLARKARETFDENRRVLRAHASAALAAQAGSDLEGLGDTLSNFGADATLHDRYLLARIARFDPDQSQPAILDELLETNPDHFDTNIELVASLIRSGRPKEAQSAGTKILNGRKEAASPYQIARLRNTVADALAEADRTDSALEHYEKAIAKLPERASVYLPSIDHFLDAGDLARAEEQIETAQRNAHPSPELDLRRARLGFYRGRFDRALALLDRASSEVELAPLLKARILIAAEEYEKATNLLGDLSDFHPRSAALDALEQLAAAGAANEIGESELEAADNLVSEHGDDPVVLRSAAKLRIRASKMGPEGDHLDRAEAYLEKAHELQPQRSLNDYLRCEIYRLRQDPEEASKYCDRARERNDRYLPGMLTAARLDFLEQTPTDAALLLARLAGAFDDSWKVTKLRMRSLFETHRPQQAAELLEEWRGRSVSDTPEFQLFEGHAAFFQGDYSGAVDHYRNARDSEEHTDEARLYYAHTLVRLGNFEEAEKIVRELKELDDWSGPAWAVFGELRLRQDEVLDAIQNLRIGTRHYDREVDSRERIAHLYGQRALAWVAHRDWNDSRVERYLSRGREYGDPNSPELMFPLGMYYLNVRGNENDPGRAVELLERTVEIQPKRCEAIRALHAAYEKTRDYGGIKRMEKRIEDDCGE